MSDFCHCILLKKLDFKSKPYISVRMRPLVLVADDPVDDLGDRHMLGLCFGFVANFAQKLMKGPLPLSVGRLGG